MADLGVTVELIPNFDKLESALSNYKDFPIQVDAAALQKSISSAIKNASSTKLKVNVDTANITAQIKKAISAAGTLLQRAARLRALHRAKQMQRRLRNGSCAQWSVRRPA